MVIIKSVKNRAALRGRAMGTHRRHSISLWIPLWGRARTDMSIHKIQNVFWARYNVNLVTEA